MADKPEKPFHYGGQAVIEGVMMRGRNDFAVAVRRTSGEIVTTTENIEKSILGRMKWLDKPFLRGTLALIDAMTLGIKALKYSADVAMQDAMAEDAAAQSDVSPNPLPEKSAQEPSGKSRVNDVAVGAMMVVGLALGLGLFFFLPIVIVRPLKTGLDLPTWQLTAIEGGVKISLFVLYVSLISLMKDIRRVFQYHGAEHKTINAYEGGAELTVDGVVEYNKVHVRCGTSFILVVLVTSIIVFMFIGWDNILVRFALKLALLPLVAGVAYEVIRFAGGRKDSVITRLVLLPGLLMQKITTREPEPEMIEVAIRSLKCVLDKETVKT